MIAAVDAVVPLGAGALISVLLPAGIDARRPTGRFFLARSCDGGPLDRPWTPYLRRTLWPARASARGDSTRWTLLLPPAPADGGHRWLMGRPPGSTLDLLGPYGSGLVLPPHARTLLLAANATRAPLLFPLIEDALDLGGRVTLLLVSDGAPQTAEQRAVLLPHLPLAVEVRDEDASNLTSALVELSRWADFLCLALDPAPAGQPQAAYAPLAHALRAARFRLDPGFAFALADAPLPCGAGACLGCIVPLASGGFTRACVHGPFFDLTRLG